MGIRSIASGVNVMLLIAQIALGVIIGSLTIALLVTGFFSLEYSALPQARMIIVAIVPSHSIPCSMRQCFLRLAQYSLAGTCLCSLFSEVLDGICSVNSLTELK